MQTRPSNQEFTFSQVPRVQIERSSFRRSHGFKTTFDPGWLIPCYIDEVLPGDTFSCRATFFTRLATPLVAFMDNVYLDVFYFFVPNRLLWSNWQKFCGEQVNPGDSTVFLTPVISSTLDTDTYAQTIWDYMGLPLNKQGGTITFQAMPFRAYNLIYNEWFRDQNMESSAPKNTGDGPDNGADYVLRKRNKRHDYFTSCLPWPQKGAAVTIGIGATAPVVSNAATPLWKVGTNTDLALTINSNANPAPVYIANPGALAAGTNIGWGNPTSDIHLEADLSAATAVTINSLRQAFQIQKLLERDARGGTRYREILQAHFGVVSPDARLQRPEYLGGGTVPIQLNPVVQTSASAITGSTTPIGKVGAFGVGGNTNIGFTKSFVEHGWILGIMSARADMTYQQGLARMWSRRQRYDFYWPSLAHIGEQTVLNKEIWAGTANDDNVFGYQERWAEYRYYPSLITGKFRSSFATPLDYWHLAQKFTALPALNQTFMEEAPPIDRVVAVSSEPKFLMDAYFDITTARPMPTYSVPGMIDHF